MKKKLKVTFVGEAGLDMGGLTKEWFLLLIRQIFHTDYGETYGTKRSGICVALSHKYTDVTAVLFATRIFFLHR